MHALTELPAWERLLKKIVWEQLGPLSGQRILDFGSGQGVTVSHFARDNRVVAVEPFRRVAFFHHLIFTKS